LDIERTLLMRERNSGDNGYFLSLLKVLCMIGELEVFKTLYILSYIY
jgi:hypothetical protein